MNDGTSLVDISNRRKVSVAASGGTRSVARIAAEIVSESSLRRATACEDASLVLTLEELTGVADATIRRLTAAVAERTLTAASAARLAMRHAQECEPVPPDRRSPAHGFPVPHRVGIQIEGDPFEEFSLRIGPTKSGLVLDLATSGHLHALSRIEPNADPTMIIVAGRDPGNRMIAGVLATRNSAAVLRRIGTCAKWRFAQHVIVLHGAVPRSSELRRAFAGELERALARGGIFDPIATSRPTGRPVDPDPRNAILMHETLRLVEVAFPGIVRPEQAEARVRRHANPSCSDEQPAYDGASPVGPASP